MPETPLSPSPSPEPSEIAGWDLFFGPPEGAAGQVLRPGSIPELQAMLAAQTGAVVPRGAGLSYTAGVVADGPAITFDLTAIDHIEVNAADLWVRVGAGCAWHRLAAELARHDLRVPIAAPTSGLHSTVGGAISQAVPGTMEAVLGLTVALVDGSLLTTGSAAASGRSAFNRTFGPDLTGLFIGDCGALGLKAEVVLRLIRAPKTDFASFRFADPVAMVAAMVDLQRELGLASMGIDPVRSATAMRSLEAAEALRSTTGAMRESGSLRGAMRSLVDLARSGAGAAADGWSLHVTAEHPVAEGARAMIGAARSRVTAGEPIAPGIPRAARANPFSVRGALGPQAERWVPVHGILPLSQAVPAMTALLAYVADHRSRMEAAGVFMAWLATSRHGAVLFEPMLFWPDALTPVHRRYLGDKLVRQAEGRAAPQATRDLVAQLRRGLCAIMDAHGATHLQLGRYYDYAGLLAPRSLGLLRAVKQALDPEGRCNPGVLGLPAGAA